MPKPRANESEGETRNGRSNILDKLKGFAFKKQREKLLLDSVSGEEDAEGKKSELGNGRVDDSRGSDEDSGESPVEKSTRQPLTDSESEDGSTSSASNSDCKAVASPEDFKSCIRNSFHLLSASKRMTLGLPLANGSAAKESEAKEPTPSDFTAKIKQAFSNLPGKRTRCVVESSDEERSASPSVSDNKDVGERSSESTSDQANRKRGRFILESSDEGSDASDESSNRVDDADIRRKEGCLSKITALFPQWDYMELQDILIRFDWCVDKSIDHLQDLAERKHSHRKRKIRIRRQSSDNDDDKTYSGPKTKKPSSSANKGVMFESDGGSEEEAGTKTSSSKKGRPSRRKQRLKSRAEDDADDSYMKEHEVVYDSDVSEIDDTVTPARKMVLTFYSDATADELACVPGCSKKKAGAIMEMRPFSGWCDLVAKFQTGRSVNTELLNKAKELLHSRKIVTQLMRNCSKLAEKMEGCVARLMNGGGDEGHLTEQPELLNEEMSLSPYQMLGLNWLILLHQQNVSGILADEMGLGKTVQTIAFLAHLMAEGNDGPHLVIVPASTLANWVRELQTWWPSANLLTYHGSQDSRRHMRMRILKGREVDFNVLVTTYNMAAGNAEDRTLFRKVSFRYVVYDEAHLLKNMETLRYQYLMKIQAERRLLLTGTPLQNNLVELMSLLVFVMPNMFEGKINHLKNIFTLATREATEEARSSFEKDRIEQAKNIMKPFLLRRLKSEVLGQLPEKSEEVVHCRLALNQREQYDSLVLKFSRQVRDNKEKHTFVSGNSGIGMMMQLRRLANHPLLMRHIYTDDVLQVMSKLMLNEPSHLEASADLIFEDMQVMSDFELHKLCKMYKSLTSHALEPHHIVDSGKFIHLNKIMERAKKTGNRILLFSQFVIMLDIVEEYMDIKGHKIIRLDGSTAVSDRQELIDRFTNDDSIFVFLLSTRAGGLGINLTAASTVVLHDIDFNPYNDKQAEDRCHRIGQTRTVQILRLVSKDTIEEGILQSALRKLKLEKVVTSSSSKSGKDDSSDVASLLKEALGL